MVKCWAKKVAHKHMWVDKWQPEKENTAKLNISIHILKIVIKRSKPGKSSCDVAAAEMLEGSSRRSFGNVGNRFHTKNGRAGHSRGMAGSSAKLIPKTSSAKELNSHFPVAWRQSGSCGGTLGWNFWTLRRVSTL